MFSKKKIFSHLLKLLAALIFTQETPYYDYKNELL